MTEKKATITLRKRVLATGKTSLYLDVYEHGRRKYEYLNLYLVPEHTRADKEKNRETLRLAKAVCAKRVVEQQNGRFGFEENSTVSVLEYTRQMVGTYRRPSWGGFWVRFKEYCPRTLTFKELDKEFCKGFLQLLEQDETRNEKHRKSSRPLAPNTKHNLFSKLCAMIHAAMKDGLLASDPTYGIEKPKQEESQRAYLTLDELRKMADTPCRNEAVRRAFLFSCLTGLRRSDIERLTWGDVQQQGDFVRIVFRQKKTRGQEYLDITPQAVAYMGERQAEDVRVFPLPDVKYANAHVKTWAQAAGIEKHITFHCARHTFAVLMLDIGTDIYTVSKLLGHREISTTQIYAKVLDKNKQAAVLKIPQI